MLEISGQREKQVSPRTVPSTPTFTDALQKHKQLELDNNRLKDAKEKGQKDVDSLVVSIESLEKKRKDLEVILSLPHGGLADQIDAALGLVNETILAIRAGSSIADAYLEVLSKMADKIETATRELAKIEEMKKEALDLISKENDRLNRIKDDLDIYKGRLERKIKAFGLSEEIKIVQ